LEPLKAKQLKYQDEAVALAYTSVGVKTVDFAIPSVAINEHLTLEHLNVYCATSRFFAARCTFYAKSGATNSVFENRGVTNVEFRNIAVPNLVEETKRINRVRVVFVVNELTGGIESVFITLRWKIED